MTTPSQPDPAAPRPSNSGQARRLRRRGRAHQRRHPRARSAGWPGKVLTRLGRRHFEQRNWDEANLRPSCCPAAESLGAPPLPPIFSTRSESSDASGAPLRASKAFRLHRSLARAEVRHAPVGPGWRATPRTQGESRRAPSGNAQRHTRSSLIAVSTARRRRPRIDACSTRISATWTPPGRLCRVSAGRPIRRPCSSTSGWFSHPPFPEIV